MNRIFASLCLCCAISLLASSPAAAVTISWMPVGNPGNAADTVVMIDGTTGYGSVPYSYNIDRYDVTASQYVEFLNAKDPTGANTLGLYNSMMSDATVGGIDFSTGNANDSKYSIISGRGDHPVNSVTWYDAIRFTNWLNNGQGGGDTETGAYTLGPLGADGIPTNGFSITRNPGATVFLPSENEWYKAAYYNPGTSSYFQYPTSSNVAPIDSSPTALPNHANCFPGGPGNPTDVGAYSGTMSPYGAFDMGGNVYQWTEEIGNDAPPRFRILRGGSFLYIVDDLLSSSRVGDDPLEVNFGFIGFRVASVPEPSTGVLLVVA